MRFYTIYFKIPPSGMVLCARVFLAPRAFPLIRTCLCFVVGKFTATLQILIFVFLRFLFSGPTAPKVHPGRTHLAPSTGQTKAIETLRCFKAQIYA